LRIRQRDFCRRVNQQISRPQQQVGVSDGRQ
jgi:hypothetical protein